MAAIVIVASAGLLAACDKDDLGTDNPWSNGEYEFAETDLSFTDVLTSAEFWYANFTETVRYTEPNGKGKIEIEYYSNSELERMFDMIMSLQRGE